ncbi:MULTISPECIES: KTSC domain-containing protein [Xenorhabdus]|nr:MULTISPECIES: KTSC domain-containing protein [Xenorhabdus]
MEIAFHSGGIYQYDGVPDNVHQGLISASSKGKYFHQYIKNVYPYRKVR